VVAYLRVARPRLTPRPAVCCPAPHSRSMDHPLHITFFSEAAAAAKAARAERLAAQASRLACQRAAGPSAAETAARAQELCEGEVDPLVVAVLSNDLAQVKAAVRAMKNSATEVNRRMKNGENALQLALRKQFTALLTPLLLAGAAVENRDNSGATALVTQARANGDISALVCLFGASVNAMDLDGCTALHHAVRLDNRENVVNLLSQGADTRLSGLAPGNMSAYAMATHTDTECGHLVAFFVQTASRVYSERSKSHPVFV